jgi:hypothetical protein
VTSSRAAKRLVWLVALGLAAAATPPALAAEGGAPPLPDAATLAAGIIEQAGLDPLPALPIELPVAAPVEQPLELPAATAQQAVEEPAQTGADAAPPPVPVAAPAPHPAPEAAPEPPAVVPDAPPPVAVQQEPENVNVSVRIDSAGDDGAVTQVNVALETASGQYQPDEPQYQAVVPAPDAPATPTAAAEEASAAPEPAWEWSWNWDCAAGGLDPFTLPAGAPVQNWNWIWNWNCGGDTSDAANNNPESTAGYHSTPVQYRPININVSIRINSPGNNGAVTQANVAVGVGIPVSLPAPPPVQVPPGPLVPAPAETPAAPAPGPAPPESGAPVEAQPTRPVVPPSSRKPPAHDCCLLPESRGAAPAPERPASILVGGGAPTVSGIASLPGDTVAVAARLELTLRRAATAASAPPRPPELKPARKQARPAPQRRDNDEQPSAVTQSGLGFAPVGGPERSLPFAALVLLAFAFASANTSLASVRSRPTPSADADDPPDRPG